VCSSDLHALAQFLLAQEEGIGADFYVSHVDIFAYEWYIAQPVFERN
jgi:hypothetical protein